MAYAQVPVEESISTRALVKKSDADLHRGVVDMSIDNYRDSLSRYLRIEDISGPEEAVYNYHNAIFGNDTLSFKQRRPVFSYTSQGRKRVEFTAGAWPYHRYSFDISGMSKEEIDDVVDMHKNDGKDDPLMNNEQTCIFYALMLMFNSESFYSGLVISNNTTFTDGRQLNAFFDYFLEEKSTIISKWKEVRKSEFPDNSVLAFVNDKDEIIHAVFCKNGTEYNPK